LNGNADQITNCWKTRVFVFKDKGWEELLLLVTLTALMNNWLLAFHFTNIGTHPKKDVKTNLLQLSVISFAFLHIALRRDL
jgi:hypothetical protein